MAGIVVEHKDNGMRFALSEKNFNPKVHKKVRDLKPGETVLGYRPRRMNRKDTPATPTTTEGSAPAGTKEAK
ncbi:hypothetical protein PBI_PAJAZA_12 [Microbacterium phage Pajaza]|uniref:Uncharacterized protein n=1 Tax=Microbacterium phage Pajaza TaxID=2099443 RepID=A0A2P1CIG0_9CAUD|nr:hypothetical protein PBI_PAJAZA_12 [Microbacterium phage Pajaza]